MELMFSGRMDAPIVVMLMIDPRAGSNMRVQTRDVSRKRGPFHIDHDEAIKSRSVWTSPTCP